MKNINRYKPFYNKETGLYDIYEVYGRYVVSCTNLKAAYDTIELLENDNFNRTPANRNSILETPIAKKVRELLGKEK